LDVAGYTDLALLCRGGFSTVYRARQLAMDRPVALKVLDLALTDPQARDRFRRECAAAGRVGAHPAIVTVHDSGFTDDGRPFLSMELCEGGSLADAMRASGPLPVEQVLRIGVAIAGALAFAHNAGVLHRDVKPGNILLTGFGEPVLTDFGIAAMDGYALSTQTSTSFTVAHAAPECLAGQPSSRASDLYSLASTLFTLLSGHPPFQVPESASPLALAVKVIDGPVPRLPRDDVPDGLVALLETGMAKQPDRRPVDASVFGRELQRIQAECGFPVTEWVTAPGQESWDEPTTAPPVGPRADESTPAGLVLAPGLLVASEAAEPRAEATAAVPAAVLLATDAGAGAAGHRIPRPPAAVGVAAGPPGAPAAGPPPGPLGGLVMGMDAPPPRRGVNWTVAAAVALLVIAGAALFVFRLAAAGPGAHGGSGLADAEAAEPSTSSSVSAGTATGGPEASTLPTIVSLSAAGGGRPVAACPSPDAVAMVDLTWQASNASTAWLAVDAGNDASVHPLRSALPATVGPGNPEHPVERVPFDCSASRHTYTLTVLGPGGKVSRSIVYTAGRASGSASTGIDPAAEQASVMAESRQSSGGTTRSTTSGSVTGSATRSSSPTSAGSTSSRPPSRSTTATTAPADGVATTPPVTTSEPPATSSPPTATSSAPATTSEPPTSDGSTDDPGSSTPASTDVTSDPGTTDAGSTDPVTTATATSETATSTSDSSEGGEADAGTATSGPSTEVSTAAV
jgi:hypothetical protein